MGTSTFKITVTTPMTECMDEYGPRFDTLGAVTSIRMNGVEFCSREGLIDEFNIQPPLSPPGYDEAKPEESFLKIGVGELVRPDRKTYKFSHPYAIRKIAPPVIKRLKNQLELKQTCSLENGWGYDYRKIIRIQPENAVLEIEYFLKNTGDNPILAEQYNHNWFNFGGGAVDESYALEHHLPTLEDLPAGFTAEDGRITLSEKLTKAKYYPSTISLPAGSNRFRLSQAGTGRAVTATGDFEVSRFALYGDQTALCPEVFAQASVEPGKSVKWVRRYEFQNPN